MNIEHLGPREPPYRSAAQVLDLGAGLLVGVSVNVQRSTLIDGQFHARTFIYTHTKCA